MAGFQFKYDINGDYKSVSKYHVDSGHSTRLAVGDVVIQTGTQAEGRAEADTAVAGGIFLGVIVGVEPDFADESFNDTSLPASTAGFIHVNRSPSAVYEVAGDGTNALAVTDVGTNADIVATAATRSGGVSRSNMVLDTSSVGTGTAQFRIEELVDGDVTTAQKILVRPVESYLQSATGV
jgi:hypothetical protein